MKLQPTRLLNSKILVLPKPKSEETLDSGIIVAESVGNLLEAEVLVVADDIAESVLKKGETIIFHEGQGIKQYYNQKECLYLDIKEVIAVV